jgi:type I restriction enzyme R subunit
MYRHNLPHWRQAGATYFVTFRLGDALPAERVEQIRLDQKKWLASKGISWDQAGIWQQAFEALSRSERHDYYKCFNQKLQAFLDNGYGGCLLRERHARSEVESALKHFHQERLWLGDFVIMPNHVHALITPMNGYELEDILASVKKFSAKKINERMKNTGAVWQKEGHDHIVRDLDELKHFRRYIRRNPENLDEGQFTLFHAEWMDAWIC